MHASDHQVAAASHVIRVLDDRGNTTADIFMTYRTHLSQGEHRADDLRMGQAILIALDLVSVTDEGGLQPTRMSRLIAQLPEPEAIAYLRQLIGRQNEIDGRAELGSQGELAVLDACRAELLELQRGDLADAVHQVSLMDDTLGYDILAPSIRGPSRWLEVKTTALVTASIFQFFLTRNEFDCGRREPASWAMVACVRSADGIEILGWCRSTALVPYLPDDGDGRWTEAMLRIPTSVLVGGHPPPV